MPNREAECHGISRRGLLGAAGMVGLAALSATAAAEETLILECREAVARGRSRPLSPKKDQ